MSTDQSTGIPRFRDDCLPVPSAVQDAAAIAREFVKPAFNMSIPITRDASLNGKSILVTRDADELDPLAVAIRDHGGIPVIAPATTTAPIVASHETHRIVELLGGGEFDLLAFTSPRAVQYFSMHQPAIEWPARTRVAAIGDGTAHALEVHGIDVDLRPNDASGTALAEVITQQLPAGAKVLHIGPLTPRPELGAGLTAAGHHYQLLPLYRTIVATEPHQLIQQHIARNEFDAVVVLAPSALHGFRAQSGDQWELARHLPVVCIGHTTASTARALGMTSVSIAGEPNSLAVASALIKAVQSNRVTV